MNYRILGIIVVTGLLSLAVAGMVYIDWNYSHLDSIILLALEYGLFSGFAYIAMFFLIQSSRADRAAKGLKRYWSSYDIDEIDRRLAAIEAELQEIDNDEDYLL